MGENSIKIFLAGAMLAAAFSSAIAQEDEQTMEPAAPVELYACSYNEGMGPVNLDAVSAKFNAWADKQKFTDYSAWTLAPFYMSANQDFDFLWLGASPNAKAMGRAQDSWLATGGEVQQDFAKLADCGQHANYATLQFKTPPERKDSSQVVLSFSDCNMTEGTDFGAVAPALNAWSEYISGQASNAGMWVLFPAYGGGAEEFDFKLVHSYANLEEQGVDWDNYSATGWAKAEELFAGKLNCDSSRVYIARNRRMAAADD